MATEQPNVGLKDLIAKMELTNLTPELDLEDITILHSDINRPALQLAGFFDYFDSDRVQVIGKVEYAYLNNMFASERKAIVDKLFSSKIPCLILAREMEPLEDMLESAARHEIPLLQTPKNTSYFISELNRYLKVELAPSISIHGVLVDVYGEGILITGESGIGKSETALELIKRGHRLVADDVVEIKKVSDQTLLGTSPDIIRHFIEVRGIGIVDCKVLFGVESVQDRHGIDVVIKLEDWNPEKEYDRLGMVEDYMDILGNKVVCHTIPIRPGRNLAIIVESAAINHRQKAMGYNAAVELNNRVLSNLAKRTKDKHK
ncbi:HPr(Ser) kinase/phosphatase [Anaerotalea alkaliphila]|uniref:HPr kinase/phosphorylase n=1 Tax=Anaerotalea alkaliphila TaxID=2662126 RepID=A0A7X5KLY4_9FIRM|nr:HPr(Ser) kinase/phosphatase [Anaerotalea alkaliphila]NDL67219.1 HPr kinase/phosphorylase [Anaerotalea alkaliphila]